MKVEDVIVALSKLPADTMIYIEAGDFAASDGELRINDGSLMGLSIEGVQNLTHY